MAARPHGDAPDDPRARARSRRPASSARHRASSPAAPRSCSTGARSRTSSRYARDRDARHLPAWRAFNQRVRDSGDVGIWHETYRVRAGEYEAIYGNMPRVGLAAVGDHRAIGTTSATAASRIGLRPDDVAAGRRLLEGRGALGAV